MNYYNNKIDILKKIFDSEIIINNDLITINQKKYQIINDVIVLNDLNIEENKEKKS